MTPVSPSDGLLSRFLTALEAEQEFQPLKAGTRPANPLGMAVSTNHVLLVSDEGVQSRSAQVLLRGGFAVAVVSSGLAALNAANRTQQVGSQVVVIDANHPQLDVIGLVRQLREQVRNGAVGIIVVADTDNQALELACLQAGADDFIRGSRSSAVLVARVRAQSRTVERTSHLHQLAVRDELTGAHNRRGTLHALKAELDRSRRSGRMLSLLLIDIDRFKAINDQHGHQVGDRVLADLAERMDRLVRSTDIVGRLGGDEFVVVLPGVDDALVHTLASRVRKAAGEVMVSDTERVHLSIGIATFDPAEGQKSPEELIDAADSRMYSDKRERRKSQANGLAA